MGRLRAPDCGIEMNPGELGAIVELAVVGRIACVAALIPNRNEPRVALRVEEVWVRKVETLHVDDADEDACTTLVPRGRRCLRAWTRRRAHCGLRDDRLRRLQRLADLDEADPFVFHESG